MNRLRGIFATGWRTWSFGLSQESPLYLMETVEIGENGTADIQISLSLSIFFRLVVAKKLNTARLSKYKLNALKKEQATNLREISVQFINLVCFLHCFSPCLRLNTGWCPNFFQNVDRIGLSLVWFLLLIWTVQARRGRAFQIFLDLTKTCAWLVLHVLQNFLSGTLLRWFAISLKTKITV